MHDGVALDLSSLRIEQIRDEDEYSGLRATVPAQIHRSRVSLKVDVSTGDPIWPSPEDIELPGLLGDPVVMKGHPLVTVIAEKSVTLLQRGTASTRWRDLLDVARLAGAYEFQASELSAAISAVAGYRSIDVGSLSPVLYGYGQVGQAKWAAWRRKYQLEDVCAQLLDDQVANVLVVVLC